MANLKPLIEYQQADIELKKMLIEVEKHPDYQKLSKTKADFASAKQAVADSESAAGQIVSFYAQAQKFYEESVEKTEELLAALEKLPEDDEAGRKDILDQLETARGKMTGLEKKMGDRRQKSETVIRVYLDAQERGKKLKDLYAKLKERIDAFQKESEPKINALRKSLKDKRAIVEPKLMERYTQLSADNKFPPLAESRTSDGGKTYVCLGCGLSISQASKSELLENGFSSCDTCRRMIYKPD